MSNRLSKLLILFCALFLIFSCSSDEDKLFKAIKDGDLEEVKSLVEEGVSVLSINKNGITALEIARLNNQMEIAAYLYDETKKILDKETDLLIKLKYSADLRNLIDLNENRIKYSDILADFNVKILDFVSADRRISEDILIDQEKYFKAYQKSTKDFINSKVDLIENLLSDLIEKNYVSDFESKDSREIVNSNIMNRLDNSN